MQDGASKVFSPVRDVSDWVSSTLRAKNERNQLRRQNQQLTTELAVAQQKAIDNRQLAKLVGVDRQIGAAAYRPVGASVISRDQSVWYQQVGLNVGSDDGVRLGDPVLGDGALVGKISVVNGSSSEVLLITDHTSGVAAEVQNGKGDAGVLEPAVGNINQLVLQDLPNGASISPGDLVVTVGFKDPGHSSQPGSLYPPGIPIGRVADFSQNALINNGQVPVTPAASLRLFTSVQVLTKPYASSEAADVGTGTEQSR